VKVPAPRNFLPVLLLISAVIRLFFFFQMRGTDFTLVPLLDAETYHEWAIRLASGDPGWNETYWMGPLYPHFLALIYLAFGVGTEAVFLIQLGLSLLNVWLVHRLALGLWENRSEGPAAAVLAAALFAFYGPGVFYAGTLLMAVLTTTLILLVALQTVRAVDAPSPRRWFVLGLLVGLAGLSRGNSLLLLATLPVLLWKAVPWKVVPGAEAARRRALVALILGGILALAPVTARNLIVAHDFTILTSNGGVNLYIGQKADRQGLFGPVIDEAQAEPDHSMEETLEREVGHDLKGSEVSRILTRRAVNLFFDDFSRMPTHYLRKAYRFWNGYELPQIVSYDYWRTKYKALLVLPVPYVLLSALGLLGMWFLPVRARWIVGILLGTWFLSLWPFFPTARYRQPIAPILAVPAAAYLIALFRGHPHRGRWILAGLLLVAALWPRWASLPSHEVLWQVHLHQASRAANLGNMDQVLLSGNAAENARPGLPETPFRVARLLEDLEAWEQALAALGMAESLAPANRLIPYRAGRVLEQAGRPAEAVDAYGRAADLDPDWPYPWLRAGLVHNHEGNKDEALKFLERAYLLDPGSRRIRANLASLYAETGRSDDALRLLEDLVRDYPKYVNGWFNLAVVHLQAGRLGDAEDALGRAAALPGLDKDQQRQVNKLTRALEAARRR